jgi:hypothetical protein
MWLIRVPLPLGLRYALSTLQARSPYLVHGVDQQGVNDMIVSTPGERRCVNHVKLTTGDVSQCYRDQVSDAELQMAEQLYSAR